MEKNNAVVSVLKLPANQSGTVLCSGSNRNGQSNKTIQFVVTGKFTLYDKEYIYILCINTILFVLQIFLVQKIFQLFIQRVKYMKKMILKLNVRLPNFILLIKFHGIRTIPQLVIIGKVIRFVFIFVFFLLQNYIQ